MKSPTLLIAMVAAAPFIGSFLGLLALRLPERRSVAWGRSVCEHCGNVLPPQDLVPIVSYGLLRGRCRYCRAPIGLFTLGIEFGALAVPIWAAFQTMGWVLVASCILGWTLLLLAVVDWRTLLLPDVITLPLLVLGLIGALLIVPESILDHVIGAAVGFAALVILALAYAHLRGREGLGLGDAKLFGAIGAWVSWHGLASVLLWGSVLGLLFAIVGAAARRSIRLSDRLPFGVFLAAGAWLVWLYGPFVPVAM